MLILQRAPKHLALHHRSHQPTKYIRLYEYSQPCQLHPSLLTRKETAIVKYAPSTANMSETSESAGDAPQ